MLLLEKQQPTFLGAGSTTKLVFLKALIKRQPNFQALNKPRMIFIFQFFNSRTKSKDRKLTVKNMRGKML